jgi:hypothetical protein
MVDRSVEVRLRADVSNYQRGINSAGVDTMQFTARLRAMDAALDAVERRQQAAGNATQVHTRRVRAQDRAVQGATTNLGAYNTALGNTNTAMGAHAQRSNAFVRGNQQSSSSINQLTGRLGLAVDGVLTLGSALVPMGALAGQAAAGLAAMGAAGAVAAASALLAFRGVGDAVKAVQKYQDDPSLENLRAANKELDAMAPAAAQFVVQFQKAKPLLRDIQQSAARGWFPGLTSALGELDEVSPKLERILVRSGELGGFLVKDGLESLGGERWEEFFDFVAEEVPSAEASLARVMGDLTHGAAEMWMAFDPGNDSFIAWVEDVANSFDSWASSADGRQDVEDFLAYARENGPEVADFLSAVGGSLVAIVKAAAPLGGPTLQILTVMAETFEAFASSDIATPLIAGLAALRIYTRAAALATAAQARLNTTMAGGTGAGAAAGAAARGAGVPLFGALSASQRAQQTAAQAAARQAQQRAMIMRGAAAGISGGLLASGAASELGLTNTAMLTLMGTLSGGWMPAIGAAAGLTLDAAAANDSLTKSLEAAGAAIESGDMAAGLQAMNDALEQQAEFEAKIDRGKGFGALKDPSALLANTKSGIEGALGSIGIGNGSDVEDGQRALADLNREMFLSQHAAAGLADAMGTTRGPLDGSAKSVTELQHALALAQPAMDRTGISMQDLVGAKRRQTDGFGALADAINPDGSYDALTAKIASAAKWMDSAAGKAQDYRVAVRGLATDQGTAAEQADRYRETFDAIVSPANDAEAALTGQVDALQAIRKLSTFGGFDAAGGDNAQANAATTRDYTAAVRERIATMIAARRSDEDVAATLQESRRQFIESGVAAGFSAREMSKRANAIGLTPRLIETTFRALGIGAFEQQVNGIKNLARGVPKSVLTDIATNGVPKTAAQITALLGKYKLTEKQRTAVLALIDRASGQIPAAIAALQSYDGRRADSFIYTHHVTTYSGAGTGRSLRHGDQLDQAADGATVPKTGLPYADRHLYLLADEEEVISNRRGQATRRRALLKGVNRDASDVELHRLIGLADGGTAGAGLSGLAAVRRYESARSGYYDDNSHLTVKAAKALDKLATAAEKAATAALDEARDRARAARDLRTATGSSLAVGELTGNGLAGFDAGLSANRNDTRAGAWALQKARGKGLGGKNDTGGLFQFLAGSGDLQLIQQFAGLNRKQLRQRELQYASMQAGQARFGDIAVAEKYGRSIRSLDHTVSRLNEEIRDLKHQIGRDVREGARAGTREGANDRDRRVSAGSRTGR